MDVRLGVEDVDEEEVDEDVVREADEWSEDESSGISSS